LAVVPTHVGVNRAIHLGPLRQVALSPRTWG